MSRSNRLVILALLACIVPFGALRAENTGASFLKIGVGARALGMGSAFTATADDSTAVYWNPAGLGRLNKREVSAMHTEWVEDIRFDHFTYTQPTAKGTFAGSVAYLSQGDLEKRGENRERLGGFQARDAAAALSFGKALSGQSSGGFSVKWIEQKIDNERASGPAMDFGYQRAVNKRFGYGLALQNLGPKMKFIGDEYKLPLSLTAGGSIILTHGFTIAADVKRFVNEKQTVFGVGSEYWLANRIALRGGYLTSTAGAGGRSLSDNEASRLSRLAGLNMGLGLRLFSFQMDYALTPTAEFGNTHRVSLSYRLQ